MQCNMAEYSMHECSGGLQDVDWHSYYTPHGFSNAFNSGYADRPVVNGFSLPHQNPFNSLMYPFFHGEQKLPEMPQPFHPVANASESHYLANSDGICHPPYISDSIPSDVHVKREEDQWTGAGLQRAEYYRGRKEGQLPAANSVCTNGHLAGAYNEPVQNSSVRSPGSIQPSVPLARSAENANLCASENQEETNCQSTVTEFKCDECSRGYTTSRSLAIHKRSHSGEKPYGCNLCNKRFNQWNVWSMHMKAHAGTKDFVCPLCRKAFSQSGHLFTHMQNHQNIKKHACDICKKRFIGKGDLIRHQRSHTGEKPFSCCQCTRRFSRKESLKYHLFLHDDVRPHNCPLCAKSYTKISTLKTHFKKVHNVGDLDSFITHREPSNKSPRKSTKTNVGTGGDLCSRVH